MEQDPAEMQPAKPRVGEATAGNLKPISREDSETKKNLYQYRSPTTDMDHTWAKLRNMTDGTP